MSESDTEKDALLATISACRFCVIGETGPLICPQHAEAYAHVTSPAEKETFRWSDDDDDVNTVVRRVAIAEDDTRFLPPAEGDRS